MTTLRQDLTPMPERMTDLPIDERGYPVPWFVAWVNGKPEFKATDGRKFSQAIQGQLCWVCGTRLHAHKTFVVGPMCGINRNSSEPPSHTDCAVWSAINCPFLSNSKAKRGDTNGEGFTDPPGEFITRNPGLVLLWTTRKTKLKQVGPREFLVDLGEPHQLDFYKDGRRATREEVNQGIDSGLPILMNMAIKDGNVSDLNDAVIDFHKLIDRFFK